MVIQTEIDSGDAAGLGWMGGDVSGCEFLLCFGRLSQKWPVDLAEGVQRTKRGGGR